MPTTMESLEEHLALHIVMSVPLRAHKNSGDGISVEHPEFSVERFGVLSPRSKYM